MPEWPHEYLVRERVDEILFEQLVKHIRQHGCEGKFYRKNMVKITRKGVDAATSETSWDFGNKLLCGMCKKSSGHTEESKVIAKVWLIGRAYAAAIERRKTTGNFSGDDLGKSGTDPVLT